MILELVFDPLIVELQSDQVHVGSIWDIEPLCECVLETGCLNICMGLTQTDEIDRIKGSGILFTFSLKGVNIGESEISLCNMQLIDENGEDIGALAELELINSVIYVGNEIL